MLVRVLEQTPPPPAAWPSVLRGRDQPQTSGSTPPAYPILPGEQHQREPRASTYADLSLKSTLDPPKGKAQRGEQRTALRGCLCYTLLVHHHSVARSFHIS